MNEWNTTLVSVSLRGAFSYVKRVTQKLGKTEYAAKFVSTRAKKKTSALREMKLLSRLDHDRVLYFHDAFEKKNAVVIVTELYPCHRLSRCVQCLMFARWTLMELVQMPRGNAGQVHQEVCYRRVGRKSTRVIVFLFFFVFLQMNPKSTVSP